MHVRSDRGAGGLPLLNKVDGNQLSYSSDSHLSNSCCEPGTICLVGEPKIHASSLGFTAQQLVLESIKYWGNGMIPCICVLYYV